MPGLLRAPTARRRGSRWLLTALVAALVGGVLLMHTLAAGAGGASEHSGMAMPMASSHAATAQTAAVTTAVTTAVDAEDHSSHGAAVCGAVGVCLALVVGALLLVGMSRTGPALLRRRRGSQPWELPRVLALARVPAPPDLHALSILRC